MLVVAAGAWPGVHVQSGSPSSSPFVLPSPSLSCLQMHSFHTCIQVRKATYQIGGFNAVVYETTDTLINCLPRKLISNAAVMARS